MSEFEHNPHPDNSPAQESRGEKFRRGEEARARGDLETWRNINNELNDAPHPPLDAKPMHREIQKPKSFKKVIATIATAGAAIGSTVGFNAVKEGITSAFEHFAHHPETSQIQTGTNPEHKKIFVEPHTEHPSPKPSEPPAPSTHR